MPTAYQIELRVAKDIARKAGEIMLRYGDGGQRASVKDDGTPLTVADTSINRMVIEELARHFDDGVVGEEESTAGYGMGRRWFCDPIDGTKAYIWGIPVSMFSLGLVVDGKPVLGVVLNPFTGKLYEAAAGHGSFCNGQSLKVSSLDLDAGTLMVSRSVPTLLNNPPAAFLALAKRGNSLAAANGAVFCSSLVAAGRAVGFIDDSVSGHDMAAVQVIVEEAGGRVTAYDGEELDYSTPIKGVVVSNGAAHQSLLKVTAG